MTTAQSYEHKKNCRTITGPCLSRCTCKQAAPLPATPETRVGARLSDLARAAGRCPSCCVTIRWTDKVSTLEQIVAKAPPKAVGLPTYQCESCVAKVRTLLGTVR